MQERPQDESLRDREGNRGENKHMKRNNLKKGTFFRQKRGNAKR